MANNKRTIRISHGTYSAFNPRRYGTPWGAVVSLRDGKPHFDFSGFYSGGKGEAGEVFISAAPGDVVCEGKKDFRKRRGTQHYGIVMQDYTVLPVKTKHQAIKYLMSGQIPLPSNESKLEGTLEEQLARAVTGQNYELAAQLRDLIANRS